MTQITILIQSDYVVFDDLGQPMAQGEIHTVNQMPVIEDLISNGQAVIVSAPEIEAPVQEATPKAATTTKNSKNQETVSTSTGEI
jgi:hypothetical protein